jgi:2-keto-3-deoxy-6-phosphogluconate aldolase
MTNRDQFSDTSVKRNGPVERRRRAVLVGSVLEQQYQVALAVVQVGLRVIEVARRSACLARSRT